MKAIVLAAGVGSRVRPLTDHAPKSLLKVGDKTILERMISNIEAVGIKDILIITGYLEEQIKEFIQEKFSHLNISFLKNDKYSSTNTGYSLMMAKNFIKGDDFVKFDADVVFEKEVLRRLINNPNLTCLSIDKNIHLDKEEVKVICDKDSKVVKVGKKLDPALSNGESIGIEKLSKEAGSLLFEILGNLMKDEKNYNEYYDDSYTTLVEKGIPFHAVDITGLKWVEIDTHEDFQRAQNLFS